MTFAKTLAALTLTTSLLASACAVEDGEELDIGEAESELTQPANYFHGDGEQEIPTTDTLGAQGVLQTPSGNIYGVGSRIWSDGRRILAVRTLDFAGNLIGGVLAANLNNGTASSWANAATQLGTLYDDVIAVGGYSTAPGSTHTFLARVRSDGLYDGFGGGDGVVAYNLYSTFPREEAIAAQVWNGKIYVAGNACQNTGYGESCRIFVARFDYAGNKDTTWSGGDGLVDFPYLGQTWTDQVRGMAIQSDGGVVVLSEQDQTEYYDDAGTMVVRRVNSVGNLDTNFAGSGSWGKTFTAARGVAIDPANNYIVAVGNNYDGDEIRAYRLRNDGVEVTTFDTTVDLATDGENAHGVTIDSLGRIIIVGESSDLDSGNDLLLVQLTRGGSIDQVKYVNFTTSSGGRSVFTGLEPTAAGGGRFVLAGGLGWGGATDTMVFAKVTNP